VGFGAAEIEGKSLIHNDKRIRDLGRPGCAPQNPLHTGEKLSVIERLEEIVFSVLAYGFNARLGVADAGEENEGQVASLLDLRGQLKAVHAGHQEIDHGQVRAPSIQCSQCLPPAFGGHNIVAVKLQAPLEHAQQIDVVVNQ
jgi:hypothetical protein